MSAHGHFHSHARASARRSPPGLPASLNIKDNSYLLNLRLELSWERNRQRTSS